MDFNRRVPHILVVDDFYKNPDEVRAQALAQKFESDERLYKGKRSPYKHLLPYVKEEFERLLGVKITDWMSQPMNGIFQITSANDPLVWHSDSQDYAAAVYLTPNADNPDSYREGTSFWRDKKYDCRRPPIQPIGNGQLAVGNEQPKITSEEMCNEIYSEYNLTHADNWNLVDKVGAVYNRLVLWDAKLIHSASEYGDKERLVQLFFFSIQK